MATHDRIPELYSGSGVIYIGRMRERRAGYRKHGDRGAYRGCGGDARQ
jgi:hypothetical protein